MHQLFSSFFILLILVFFTNCNSNSSSTQKSIEKEETPVPVAIKSNQMDSIRQTVIDTINKVNNVPMLQTESVEAHFTLGYIMGKFDPTQNANFTKIEKQYASREGMYIRKDVYNAFKKMHAAAKKDGLNFTIKSATRPFDHQKRIWEGKWTGQRKIAGGKDASKSYPNPKDRALKILEFSSMPGTSRHHWGTDIDLNSFENSYFERGRGLKEYNWLLKHAATYGFCQPYTQKDKQRPNGYNEEKWHWSYLPIAKQLTDKAEKVLKDELIQGFKGAETATDIEVVKKYVLGINQACL